MLCVKGEEAGRNSVMSAIGKGVCGDVTTADPA